MRQKYFLKYFIFILFSIFFTANLVFANENDVIKEVYQCERNIILKMQNSGTLGFSESDVGELNFEDMMHLAYQLQYSHEKTGYFDPGEEKTICDYIKVRKITVLEKKE